jgi:hypothetical protein
MQPLQNAGVRLASVVLFPCRSRHPASLGCLFFLLIMVEFNPFLVLVCEHYHVRTQSV